MSTREFTEGNLESCRTRAVAALRVTRPKEPVLASNCGRCGGKTIIPDVSKLAEWEEESGNGRPRRAGNEGKAQDVRRGANVGPMRSG
jgi:hypothetical protein